jgi:hypothetical protein
MFDRKGPRSVAWIRLLKEVGRSATFIDNGVQESIDEFKVDYSRREYFNSSFNRNVEGTVAYIQLVRAFGDPGLQAALHRNGVVRSLADRLFNGRHLVELLERDPEEALAELQLLQDLDGGPELMEWTGKPSVKSAVEALARTTRLFEQQERSPQGALAYVQALTILLGQDRLTQIMQGHARSGAFERILRPTRLLEPNDAVLTSWALALAYARFTRSPELSQRLISAIRASMYRSYSLKALLYRLPISSLRDLRWLADRTEDAGLLALVADLTE